MTRPSSRDSLFALNLPENFLRQPSQPALERVSSVVRRHWSGYPEPARADLAQALLPILGPLDTPGRVSEEIRAQCEQAVLSWLEEQ